MYVVRSLLGVIAVSKAIPNIVIQNYCRFPYEKGQYPILRMERSKVRSRLTMNELLLRIGELCRVRRSEFFWVVNYRRISAFEPNIYFEEAEQYEESWFDFVTDRSPKVHPFWV